MDLDMDITWREIFDEAPVALSLIDVYGRQIAGNAAYAQMFGYSPDEVTSLDVGNVTRPGDQTWTASYLISLINGERDEFVTEKKYVCRDGSEVNARLTARALRRADGSCWGVLGVLMPVEERQHVDDERLRRLLKHTEASLTLVDAEGNILETSGRYQPLLGYPSEFWESRSVFDLVTEGLDDVLEFREQLLSSLGGRQGMEIKVRAADGSVQDLLVKAVNLLDDPDVRGLVLTTVNITEQRRLVDKLNHRTTTAEAVAEAQNLLLATVSHELRNPLHAVQGLAELLASEQLSPRAAELAATLASQISGLADVTQDLLDTAQLTSGTVELHPMPTDLAAMVDEVVGYGMAIRGDKPIAVTSSLPVHTPHWVSVDRVRLRQILRNLVGNAVKFTSAGTVILEVALIDDGTVSFSVTDTGAGIHEVDLERILEPFGTGSTAGAERGAGLGLAIVKRLVTAMGGQLSLTSRPGQGSRFRVVLALPSAKAPVETVDGPRSSTVNVLVVEDNVVNQKLAQSQLDRLGMRSIIVASGEAAIELMSSPTPPEIDVILMDHQLPGIDGTETTRQLRLLGEPLRSLPVICLTASASASDRERFLDAGMNGFVSKPATMDDIRSAIDHVLDDAKRHDKVASNTASNTASDSDSDTSAPKQPPMNPSTANVDTTVLDQLVEEFADASIVEMLTQTFLDELPARGNSLLDELAKPGGSPAGPAHTLKSSALLLGAKRLGELCQAIEREHRPDDGELRAVLDGTDSELRQWRPTTP